MTAKFLEQILVLSSLFFRYVYRKTPTKLVGCKISFLLKDSLLEFVEITVQVVEEGREMFGVLSSHTGNPKHGTRNSKLLLKERNAGVRDR